MKTLTLTAVAFSLVAPTASFAAPSDAGKQAFKRMKTLVGKWSGKMADSGETMEATVEYKLTGNNSALVETLGPGSPYEMVSVYHLDGDNLVMTHYCGSGNQPFMKFKPGKDGKSLFFDFVRGSNMKPGDMHMHQVTHKFDGPDHVRSVWQSYQNGKPGAIASFDFHRVKTSSK